MDNILLVIINGLLIFLKILYVFIFIDIVFSWINALGLKWRPSFISDTLSPLYGFIKKYIPTSIGALDFTPIILLFFIVLISGLLIKITL